MMDIKSQIAPKGLEFKPSEMVISDKYCAILTIISYKKYIRYAIYQIIIILTGIKRKKFEKLRQESEERLQDYNYAKTLVSLGYSVPEEYL